MTVCSGVSGLVDVFQRVESPAREVLASIFSNAGERIHVRPVLVPVSPESNERSIRNIPVLCLIFLDILCCYSIVDVFLDLVCDIYYTQWEYSILHTIFI